MKVIVCVQKLWFKKKQNEVAERGKKRIISKRGDHNYVRFDRVDSNSCLLFFQPTLSPRSFKSCGKKVQIPLWARKERWKSLIPVIKVMNFVFLWCKTNYEMEKFFFKKPEWEMIWWPIYTIPCFFLLLSHFLFAQHSFCLCKL